MAAEISRKSREKRTTLSGVAGGIGKDQPVAAQRVAGLAYGPSNITYERMKTHTMFIFVLSCPVMEGYDFFRLVSSPAVEAVPCISKTALCAEVLAYRHP